tara:strand:+ start:8917 stop:9027 length:111 start_codon:yes stop_codon:yes gene_type:complete
MLDVVLLDMLEGIDSYTVLIDDMCKALWGEMDRNKL